MARKAAVALTLALAAVQTAVGLPAKSGKFIVGGEPARDGEFPFIVAILLDGQEDCGGSLLNDDTVLTAAHCTRKDLSRSKVRAGSRAWASGGTLVGVASTIIHPEYNATIADNDIALWKLATPIPPSPSIRYATLPEQGSDPADKTVATVAGWGSRGGSKPDPAKLQKVSVPVVDRETCRTSYQDRPNPSTVTDNMFCAGYKEGGKDSCQGDSGGPIIDAASGVLIGTVSWGEGCALPNNYGVYARVANYVDFIKKHM